MLTQLKKFVIAQKTATLPSDAPSADLKALHDSLNQYDQVISQAVIQAMQGQSVVLPQQQIDQLQAELEGLLAQADPNNRNLEMYRRYYQRLDQMLAVLKQDPEANSQ